MMPSGPRPSRFAPYKQALTTLSERTRTPLPSLVFSFAILHEVTAIVPLAGFFFAARALNCGQRFLMSFPDKFTIDPALRRDMTSDEGLSAWDRVRRRWAAEGRLWVMRVGTRYGLFGLPKRGEEGLDGAEFDAAVQKSLGMAGPHLVNAMLAYMLTKSLLPVRIGVSLYLAPAFSRRVMEPCRAMLMRAFRRKPQP